MLLELISHFYIKWPDLRRHVCSEVLLGRGTMMQFVVIEEFSISCLLLDDNGWFRGSNLGHTNVRYWIPARSNLALSVRSDLSHCT